MVSLIGRFFKTTSTFLLLLTASCLQKASCWHVQGTTAKPVVAKNSGKEGRQQRLQPPLLEEDDVLVDTSRRRFFRKAASRGSIAAAVAAILLDVGGQQSAAWARAPGSRDITESIIQIQDASIALKGLQTNWDDYATIDGEGRAGSTDAARRILGGIAPQSGSAAIEVAKQTPLYRIDGAFKAVRQAALDDDDAQQQQQWTSDLDLVRFEELVERILFALQKADGDFYSVLFAAKGTKMVSGIYKEAKTQVNQAVLDLDEMIQLFKDAGAPGL